MRTIETSQRAGPDAKLRLEIPVEQPEQLYHVIVVLEQEPDGGARVDTWPPGFIEATAGAWQGEFVQEFEGAFERREAL